MGGQLPNLSKSGGRAIDFSLRFKLWSFESERLEFKILIKLISSSFFKIKLFCFTVLK